MAVQADSQARDFLPGSQRCVGVRKKFVTLNGLLICKYQFPLLFVIV